MRQTFPDSSLPYYRTNREVANVLRLSPRTLEKMRIDGGGPRYRKLGRRVIYALDDLERWANAHSYTITSEARCPPPRVHSA